MKPEELARLDYEGASQMLFAYATDAKKYEKEIASLKEQAEEWKSKARLAQERTMEELSQAALRKSAELEARAQDLTLELDSLRRDIEDLRTAIPIIKAKQRSVDPDQLLAELSLLVGLEETVQAPKSDTKPSQNPEEPAAGTSLEALPKGTPPVDDALAELKKKMGLL